MKMDSLKIQNLSDQFSQKDLNTILKQIVNKATNLEKNVFKEKVKCLENIWIFYRETHSDIIGYAFLSHFKYGGFPTDTYTDKLEIFTKRECSEGISKDTIEIGKQFITFIKNRFKNNYVTARNIDDDTLSLWWNILGANHWIHQAIYTATKDPLIENSVQERKLAIESFYKDRNYGSIMKSIFLHIEKLFQNGLGSKEIEIAIDEKHNPTSDYRIIPTSDTIICNKGYLEYEGCGEYRCGEKYKIFRSGKDIRVVRPIGDDHPEYPSMSNSSHICAPKGLITSIKGPVRFTFIKHIDDIIPVIEKYCLYEYQIVCNVETYGPITVPDRLSHFDAILFMLNAKSLCPIFRGYQDILVLTSN